MQSLFLSPHNDDETLFGAYTLMREKPLVVIITDSFIQGLRGTGITATQRRKETMNAVEKLGCHLAFLGIKDHELDESSLIKALAPYLHYQTVYCPAFQSGHPHHDLTNVVAKKLFSRVIEYSTYGPKQSFAEEGVEVIEPKDSEYALKIAALSSYSSQMNYPPTAHHFEAVIRSKKEYIYKK